MKKVLSKKVGKSTLYLFVLYFGEIWSPLYSFSSYGGLVPAGFVSYHYFSSYSCSIALDTVGRLQRGEADPQQLHLKGWNPRAILLPDSFMFAELVRNSSLQRIHQKVILEINPRWWVLPPRAAAQPISLKISFRAKVGHATRPW